MPARVREGEDGLPAAVRLPRGWTPVVQVLERWRIDDAWWREAPISRVYHRLVLRDGRQLVLYRDLITGGWYRQRDG